MFAAVSFQDFCQGGFSMRNNKLLLKEKIFEYELYTIKMMKKKIFTVTFLLISALNGYGQLSWNAKAGMNVSKITNYSEPTTKPGYQFGAGMDYYFTESWGLQPSLMIISKGVKGKDYFYVGNDPGYQQPNASFDYSENRIYLQMPLMLAYRINLSNSMKLVLNGGGYISYGIGGKFKRSFISMRVDETMTFNGDDIYKEANNGNDNTFAYGGKFDFGLGAGTALELKNRYSISLFGEWGLKDAYTYMISSQKIRNQTYGLNIGYKF
jgi:hypothetical protein